MTFARNSAGILIMDEAREIKARDMHIEKLEDALREIVIKWERRADHFFSEGDCAAGLADIARITLPEREPKE